MATYYWVGGAGTWDGATTTNWATSSGGAGGAGVPTSADDAIFNSASNATAYTVTISAGAVCRSVNIAGPASGNVTAAGSGAWSIYGNLTLAAIGITRTYTGAITFAATTTGWTITTNGVSLASAITFNGVGGGWTLGSALTTTGAITFTNGSFSTANFNLTAATITNSGTGTNSITLGSSSVTVTASSGWAFSSTAGLTFNAGTSTITNTQGVGTSTGFGGLTYYNFAFTGTAGNCADILNDGGTFNNFSIATVAARSTNFSAGVTWIINGTLTKSGGATANLRTKIWSGSFGTTTSIYAASLALTNVDFSYVNATGTGSWTGTNLGNQGGNSGITFPAAKTVYWNLVGGGDFVSSVAWATSSGGTPSLNNYPLAQDTAVFNNTGLNSGSTITFASNFNPYTYSAPTLDFSSISNTVTLAISSSIYLYGSLTLSATVTTSGTSTITIVGPSTFTQNSATLTAIPFTIVSGGNLTASGTVTFPTTVTINGGTFTCAGTVSIPTLTHTAGTCTLNNGLTVTGTYTLTAGTLSLGTYTLTPNAFVSSGTGVRTIAFGTGQINLPSTGTIWNTGTATNLTTTGTTKVNLTGATATATTITAGAITEANAINFNITAGTYALTKSGSFLSIDYTGFSGSTSGTTTVYGNLTLSGSMTGDSSAYTLAATSGTQTFTPNGRSITGALTMSGVGGTVAIAGPLSSSSSLTISGSSFTQTNTVSCTTISYTGAGAWTTSANITNSGAITVNGASSNWTINSGTVSGAVTLTNGTITAGGTFTGSGTWTINGGTFTQNNAVSIASVTQTAGTWTHGTAITISGTLTVNGAGVTWTSFTGDSLAAVTLTTGAISLGANLTCSGVFTHTAGTVTLSTYTLSVPSWSSSNSNVRTIAFGTGQINLTSGAGGTLWTTATVTNFSYTGTSKVNITNVATNGTNINPGPATAAQALNFNITGGTASFNTNSGGAVNNYNLQGFSSSCGGTLPLTVYGDLNYGTTATSITAQVNLAATSGTQTITSNGKSSGVTTLSGVGGTVVLADAISITGALTISGSAFTQNYSVTASSVSYTGAGAWTTAASVSSSVTVNGASSNWTINSGTISNTVTLTNGTITAGGTGTLSSSLTHTAGTLVIGNNSLSIATISSANANARSITFGSGTLTVTGSGATAFNYGTSTNLSVTPGTGKISMTSASAKTFAGGSYTNYPTLNNGGAGALTVSGSNTFAGISNSVQPTTFTFTSGTTQTVGSWNVNGTSGNLVVINATTAGSQASMVYSGAGTPTSDYLNIKDSAVS